jgi:hypothetical protein
MKHRERRALKVALWAGIVGETVNVGSFLIHLNENLSDFRDAYLQAGVPGLLGDLAGRFIGPPIIIGAICGGLVWLWSLLFIKSN